MSLFSLEPSFLPAEVGGSFFQVPKTFWSSLYSTTHLPVLKWCIFRCVCPARRQEFLRVGTTRFQHPGSDHYQHLLIQKVLQVFDEWVDEKIGNEWMKRNRICVPMGIRTPSVFQNFSIFVYANLQRFWIPRMVERSDKTLEGIKILG